MVDFDVQHKSNNTSLTHYAQCAAVSAANASGRPSENLFNYVVKFDCKSRGFFALLIKSSAAIGQIARMAHANQIAIGVSVSSSSMNHAKSFLSITFSSECLICVIRL